MKQFFTVSILCSVMFASCGLFGVDEFSTFGPDYAIPLVQASTSVGAIFEKFDTLSTLEVDSAGGMTLRYKGSIHQEASGSLFDDVNNFPFGFPITSNLTEIPFNTLSGVRLDSARLKSGVIIANFWPAAPALPPGPTPTPWTENLLLSFTVEQFINPAGVPLHIEQVVPVSGNVPIVTDITGYDIVPDADGKLWISYTAVGQTSGQPYVFNGLQFSLDPNGLAASYAEGYLGQVAYTDIPLDTIEFDFLENISGGEIRFGDPKIKVFSKNAFGFPVRAQAEVVNVFTRSGAIIPLESTFIFDGINFNYPTISEAGQVKNTDFYFDKDNSNIEDIIAGDPIAIEYKFIATTNPDNDLSITGFITDSSFFEVGVEVELPLYGSAKDFPAMDTFEIDPNFDIDAIDSVELKIISEDGIPLDANFQLLFADEFGQVLDSVFHQGSVLLLRGAQFDINTSEVTATSIETNFARLPNTSLVNMLASRKLIVKALFSTSDNGNGFVRARFDQKLDLKVGVILHMKGG